MEEKARKQQVLLTYSPVATTPRHLPQILLAHDTNPGDTNALQLKKTQTTEQKAARKNKTKIT